LECLSPARIGELTAAGGENAVGLGFGRSAVLVSLAGAYIAAGAQAHLHVLPDGACFLGFGLPRMSGGLVFSVGLRYWLAHVLLMGNS